MDQSQLQLRIGPAVWRTTRLCRLELERTDLKRQPDRVPRVSAAEVLHLMFCAQGILPRPRDEENKHRMLAVKEFLRHAREQNEHPEHARDRRRPQDEMTARIPKRSRTSFARTAPAACRD